MYAAARLGERMTGIIPAQTRMREVGKKLRANRHPPAHPKDSSDTPMSLGAALRISPCIYTFGKEALHWCQNDALPCGYWSLRLEAARGVVPKPI
jgi:hypothetical protein